MIPLRRSHKTVGPRSVEAGRFGADPHHVRLPTSEPGTKDEFPTFLIQHSRILSTFSDLKYFKPLFTEENHISPSPKFSVSAKLKEKKRTRQTY